MNERAREALVAAALKGVKQIKGRYLDGAGGYCAMGVIMKANGCIFTEDMHELDVWRKVGMKDVEFQEIQRANDDLGWDFLTIARKIGNDDAVNPTQEATK